MVLRLEGPEIQELVGLLRVAFSRQRFDDLLLYRLNRLLGDHVGPADDDRTAIRKVLEDANRELWWRDLVREARHAVPGDPGLVAFGERYAFAPATVVVSGGTATPVTGAGLELKIKASQSTFDINPWRRRLGEIEGRVCRVELPEATARGTGFLVGPDLVLTNYHVVERVVKGEAQPEALRVRFDYKVGPDGVALEAGTVYELADEWLAHMSLYSEADEADPPGVPPVDELDHALLRIKGRPGEDFVGGATSDPNPVPRGWLKPPAEPYDFTATPALYIVQHPEGRPMQVAIDSEAVLGVNANGTRVRYTTTTEPGSSGSPCFGPDWTLLAMHHRVDPATGLHNRAIAMSAVQARMGNEGTLRHLPLPIGS
jgi:V8-like Glu-specific endopeptidase